MLLLFIAGVQLVLGCCLSKQQVAQQVVRWTQIEPALLKFISICLLVSGGGALLTFFILH